MSEWLREKGYRLRVPPAGLKGAEGPHPAILFLHGHGESGTDNEAQLRAGLPPVADLFPEWLIVAPQKPTFPDLWPTYKDDLIRILNEVESRYPVGQPRILTGLSQGGHGTMALLRSLPWTFDAIVPICGWVDAPDDQAGEKSIRDAGPFADPERVRAQIGEMPIWLFHGERDEAVPVARSKEVADLLPHAKLTVYPEAGHDSWTAAYSEPDLELWMRRGGR